MRANELKKLHARGETILNSWLSIPSSFSAEIMANQGFHSLTIDMQHGIIDYQVAVTMLQAISTTQTTPLVRVPWNDPAIIMKMLDAGAYGIICPMVNTPEEARQLVAVCRYPPKGVRSWGPMRALLYAGADYGEHANDEILILPMIETKEALDNLEAILQEPGIDGVYVGPGDLAFALGGKPTLDQTFPAALEAQEKIVAACKLRGLLAGIHNATAAYAMKMAASGYDLVTIGSDGRSLATQAAREIEQFRNGMVKPVKVTAY